MTLQSGTTLRDLFKETQKWDVAESKRQREEADAARRDKASETSSTTPQKAGSAASLRSSLKLKRMTLLENTMTRIPVITPSKSTSEMLFPPPIRMLSASVTPSTNYKLGQRASSPKRRSRKEKTSTPQPSPSSQLLPGGAPGLTRRPSRITLRRDRDKDSDDWKSKTYSRKSSPPPVTPRKNDAASFPRRLAADGKPLNTRRGSEIADCENMLRISEDLLQFTWKNLNTSLQTINEDTESERGSLPLEGINLIVPSVHHVEGGSGTSSPPPITLEDMNQSPQAAAYSLSPRSHSTSYSSSEDNSATSVRQIYRALASNQADQHQQSPLSPSPHNTDVEPSEDTTEIIEGISEELKDLFSSNAPDTQLLVEILQDITTTENWSLLHERIPLHAWIHSKLPDTDVESVIHDLQSRDIVVEATTLEMVQTINSSPEIHKLRQLDTKWRRNCIEMEDELDEVRKHFSELLSKEKLSLPPLRWVAPPLLPQFVTQLVVEYVPYSVVSDKLVQEWKVVASIIQGQISATHNQISIRMSQPVGPQRYAYEGWRDLCYDNEEEQLADHQVLAIPKKSTVPAIKLNPKTEDERVNYADEEIPPPTFGVEDPRAADLVVEELPSGRETRGGKGAGAKKWQKAGRKLGNAAILWRKTTGINAEKSKAQSATAEPEVDLVGSAERFKKLWNDKLDSTITQRLDILGELVDNIKVPRVCDTPELKLLTIAQAAHTLFKGKKDVAPKSVAGRPRNQIEIFIMTLYTMAGCDLDRSMNFPAVPDPDDDVGNYYDTFVGRNAAPFREMNNSMRTAIIKASEQREYVITESEKAWQGVTRWVKTLGLLYALCHDTYADSSLHAEQGFVANCPPLSRGLAGLPDDVISMHERLSPGCNLHWPAPSSCAKNEDVAKSYVNGEATNAFKAKGGTVFFTVKGLRRGLPLQEISQYPQEAEILLAPFTVFKIGQSMKVPGLKSKSTKTLVVEWVNTDILGQSFSDRVFAESTAASKVLTRIANSGLVAVRQPNEPLGIAFSSNMVWDFFIFSRFRSLNSPALLIYIINITNKQTVMEVKKGSPAANADAQRFLYASLSFSSIL